MEYAQFEKRFNELCVKQLPAFNPENMNAAAWRHAIKNMETLELIKDNNPYIPPFEPEEEQEYNDLKATRKIKSFFELPENAQIEIQDAICSYELEKGLNIEKVYLTGSFVHGSWVWDDTPQEFIDMRRKIKGWKKERSDIDLNVEPFHVPESYYNTKVVQIMPQSGHETVLIYENGVFL